MAKRLKSGHVLRIPLLHGWGFAYAKYINVLHIANNNSYPDLIKVYDYHSLNADEINTAKLTSYLMQPILLAGRLAIMREQRWQIIGEVPILSEDEELPDLRVPEGTIADRMIISHQPRPGATLYTKNLALRPYFETALYNVEHLEFLSAYPYDMIEASITMCFMLNKGINPLNYFNLQNPTYSYLFSLYSKRPLANSLPRQLYGRARQNGKI
ncbi:Imm26 family immunity protein [Hymenobacter baengnokdamensis]|uniref:Imm26 family immunity protein n=1 Tax=Hymenobacter baengnokdamensis TaxID=2615203 RepID=UPI001247E1B3|nr:Imm26 family immunity protein [Hymenobacter baengnokdamensis]